MSAVQGNNLLDALAILERSLETPLVPGEFEEWMQAVEESFAAVDSEFQCTRVRDHERQFEEIAAADPSLLRRVEQMKEEDRRLVQEFAEFRQRLARENRQAGHAEPEEYRSGKPLERFITAGLDLVIAVRKQELALSTWLTESVDRDRGDGD